MKQIPARKLHARTGKWARELAKQDHILTADNGRTVLRMVPESPPRAVPYFARRQFINRRVKRSIEKGSLGCGGTGVTQAISEDREDRGGQPETLQNCPLPRS